jgi:Peptidase_C39 like family
MIKTMKQVKKISDLSQDLEIINPIETKTLLGGEWYDYVDGGWLNTVYITPNWWASSSGSSGDGPSISNGSGGDSGGGNGNGSGSGGNGDGGDVSWSDTNGDGINDVDSIVHILPNLPGTVPKQLDRLGSCVSYAASFVLNYLGQTTNPLSTALKIDTILNLPHNGISSTAFTHGLDPNQATQAINNIFNTNQISTIAQANAAIDANHPVIANFITDPASVANGNVITAHEVVIVDYNAWNYMIADSLTGNYHWVSQSDMTFNNGAYEITGIRP